MPLIEWSFAITIPDRPIAIILSNIFFATSISGKLWKKVDYAVWARDAL